jgi:aryl-alcohol dehydrogenase-like predicted oxidoreductase
MIFRAFGGLGVEVSALALGTWRFGCDNWGVTDRAVCLRVIGRALDLGINVIDTAPAYGWGESEKIVAQALAGRRNSVFLATKCGLRRCGKRIDICLESDFLKTELENSLKNLGASHVDLYQLHWPQNGGVPDETLRTLEDFVAQGKARFIGVCNFGAPGLEQAVSRAKIISAQNEFSLLKPQAGLEVLPVCRSRKLAFMAYGALGGGILSGKYEAAPQFPKSDARSFFYRFYRGPQFDGASRAARICRDIAAQYGGTAAQCAINWALAHEGVSCVITGASSPEQLEDNAGAFEWKLAAHDVDCIDEAAGHRKVC